MNIIELKDLCNKYYKDCLTLLENREPLNNVHSKLLAVIDLLLKIGEVSIIDKKNANKKAVNLFNIARKINKDTTHDEIYFALTARQLAPVEKVEEPVKEDVYVEPVEEEVEGTVVVPSRPNVAQSQNVLRPLKLQDYIGQDDVKVQLDSAIKAAKLRGQPLKHIILFGNAGLGKTTLSRIIANEMNAGLIEMNGPTIKDVKSFVNIFSRVKEGDVVFIDEIHRLPTVCAEAIYSAMEDYQISYIDKNSKTGISDNVTIRLSRFTLIGATTKAGALSGPLRDRFGIIHRLEFYTTEELTQVIIRTSKILDIDITALFELKNSVSAVAHIFLMT